MEAPEKIYLTKNLLGELRDGWDALPSEVFTNIEYTRTDALIEKACEGIDHLLSGYIIRNFNFGDSYDIDRLIEDFKKYMKGK